MDPLVCLQYELHVREQGYRFIAGVDEAGRGPLAGPVVAAAVILPDGFDPSYVDDSKKLSPAQREVLCGTIHAQAISVGVGVVFPETIDRVNILQATYLAMRQAIAALLTPCDYILVDGLPVPDLGAPSLAIVQGDGKSASIAAASIVAKVHRDAMMVELDGKHPGYGFARNKGYGSADHLEALSRLGPCPCHRMSFAPVAERNPLWRLPGLD